MNFFISFIILLSFINLPRSMAVWQIERQTYVTKLICRRDTVGLRTCTQQRDTTTRCAAAFIICCDTVTATSVQALG